MKKNGFTLIELLVSMGIIAVLSGMAVFNFNQARMRARDVSRKSDLSQMQKALELYKNDNNGKYPSAALMVGQAALNNNEAYSKVEYVDPKGKGVWYDYAYVPSVNLNTYTLSACLENKADTTRLQPSVPCGGLSNAGVIYQISNP